MFLTYDTPQHIFVTFPKQTFYVNEPSPKSRFCERQRNKRGEKDVCAVGVDERMIGWLTDKVVSAFLPTGWFCRWVGAPLSQTH